MSFVQIVAIFIFINNAEIILDTETDRRYFMTEGVWLDEKEYEVALRGVEEVYGKPLKRLSSLTNEEHLAIFGGVSHISELSHLIISQVSLSLSPLVFLHLNILSANLLPPYSAVLSFV